MPEEKKPPNHIDPDRVDRFTDSEEQLAARETKRAKKPPTDTPQ